MKRILVSTDGEELGIRAEEEAVILAERFAASLTGLYVINTFLQKFTHEIYAVGRNECRRHLDVELERQGTAALDALRLKCLEKEIPFEARIRRGDVADEIVKEASEGSYDVLVMGAKLLANWRERFESVNVPLDIFKRSTIPVLFVR